MKLLNWILAMTLWAMPLAAIAQNQLPLKSVLPGVGETIGVDLEHEVQSGSILQPAHGGTGGTGGAAPNPAIANGVVYWDGTKLTTNAGITYDGTVLNSNYIYMPNTAGDFIRFQSIGVANATNPQWSVRAGVGQTGDLQQWQDENNVNKANISASGTANFLNGATVSGGSPPLKVTGAAFVSGTLQLSGGGLQTDPSVYLNAIAPASDVLVRYRDPALPGVTAMTCDDSNFLTGGVPFFNGSGGTFVFSTNSNLSNGHKVQGTATLVAGTVTVNTTAVQTASQVFLSHRGTGTSANFGVLSKGTVVGGTSFVINSSNGADNDDVDWWVVRP